MERKRIEPGKKKKRRKQILLVILALAAVFLFSGGLYLRHILHPLKVLQPPESGMENGDERTEIARNFDKDVINFALLGFDRTASRDRIYRLYRPDTILVASVNFRNGKINLLSIPRDSYVLIAGAGCHDKINHSFMYGHEARGLKEEERYDNGIKTVLKTVEELLGGIPIHYYVTVDMDGVIEIVDKLGGIAYDVELNIYETDGRLMVSKGEQVLHGTDYLMYARYRGVGGDIGRAERQQKLLVATVKQLKKAGKLVKLPQIYKSLTETVRTNLNFNQMAALALYGSNEVDLGEIEGHVLPGSNQWGPQGEIDVVYWVLNEQERVKIIEKVFGVTVPERAQVTLPGPRLIPPVENGLVPSPGHIVAGGEENAAVPGEGEGEGGPGDPALEGEPEQPLPEALEPPVETDDPQGESGEPEDEPNHPGFGEQEPAESGEPEGEQTEKPCG